MNIHPTGIKGCVEMEGELFVVHGKPPFAAMVRDGAWHVVGIHAKPAALSLRTGNAEIGPLEVPGVGQKAIDMARDINALID